MKTLNWILLFLVVGITACREQNVSEADTKLQQNQSTQIKSEEKPSLETLKDVETPSANTISSSKAIKFDTITYKYDLPDEMKQICGFDGNLKNSDGETINFCTEIDIKLAKIEPNWIESVVNKKITDDDSPKLLKFKQRLDDFVGEHLAYINESKQYAEENDEEFVSAPLYSWTAVPELLPVVNNTVQVVINSDTYLGGAHDVPNAEYLVFDMDLQSQIHLDDVIQKDKSNELYELAHQKFRDYLVNDMELTSEQEIKDYEDMYEFHLPENFYFSEKGLVLAYQPYEMGSFAQGFIEIELSYEELKGQGILKPSYMPK